MYSSCYAYYIYVKVHRHTYACLNSVFTSRSSDRCHWHSYILSLYSASYSYMNIYGLFIQVDTCPFPVHVYQSHVEKCEKWVMAYLAWFYGYIDHRLCKLVFCLPKFLLLSVLTWLRWPGKWSGRRTSDLQGKPQGPRLKSAMLRWAKFSHVSYRAYSGTCLIYDM